MNERTRNLIVAIIWATAITLLCALNVFRIPELWLQDELYQQPESLPGDIVVIGITEDDLRELGPYYSWDRTVMASALEALAKDPSKKPAVVAIDALYAGTTDKEKDDRLVAAASQLNVIVASEAKIGRQRYWGSSTVVEDDFAVLNYEEPFDDLKKVTGQGFINCMNDKDGILRHAQLYLEPEGSKGKRVYSLAYETARSFALQNGYSIQDPPVNSRGQYFVSFSAEPGDFYDGISLSKLIKGEIAPEFFDGKIVLIGPYAPGLQDSFITSIDRATMMYGVEYQANCIRCILDGKYKTEAPDYFQIGTLWIVCVAFFVFCNNRRLLFTVPALAMGEGLSIGISLWFYSLGYITHALWLPLGILILFVVSVAGNYIRAAIARQNVTKTFERYVAPNIVNEILKEGTDNLKLGGKLCNIAVLFVDIRGFTTMSERLSPEEVVYILNQYLSMTSACVERHQGTLDKFVGDATMAFWGAPIEDDDPVYHAALTALDIVKGADELSAKLKAEVNEEIHVGVGVHYGPAVVGNMGSERRMDYTAIGDTVNTSARLEANAPGGTIYVSRAVVDALKGRMKYEPLEKPIKLKGKADGFEILKLLGPEE